MLLVEQDLQQGINGYIQKKHNMNKFDIHVNLGSFPGSKRGKRQRHITPKEMNEYFISHGITHSLVLYNRDEYNLLEELGNLTDTVIYGVQCIMGTKENPTDINKPLTLDVGKKYVSGIKIASERGWWTNGKEVWSGIDYTDKYVSKLLKTLPKNTVVSLHTQGGNKPTNTSTPLTITNYACKFPELKFVINHGGDYGPKTQTARPSHERILNREGMGNLLRNVTHKMVIRTGLESSQNLPNVFVDSSCYTIPKGEMYREYDQWCVGSDFPFSDNHGINYTSERDLFEKSCRIPDSNGVDFFNLTIEELTYRQFEYYSKTRQEFNSLKKNINDDEERVLIGLVDTQLDTIEEIVEDLKERKLDGVYKEMLLQNIKNI